MPSKELSCPRASARPAALAAGSAGADLESLAAPRSGVEAEGADERAFARERAHTAVGIGDVGVSGDVGGHPVRVGQLSGGATGAPAPTPRGTGADLQSRAAAGSDVEPERTNERAVGGELVDAVVALIGHEDAARASAGDIGRAVELPGASAGDPPFCSR